MILFADRGTTTITSELRHWYQRIFIRKFNNCHAAKIWIYLATFAEIFVQFCSLGDIGRKKH